MHKKVEHFQALLLDAKKFEAEDSQAGIEPNDLTGETSLARVTWATRMIKAQHDSIDRLLVDLKQSMNAVCFILTLLRSLAYPFFQLFQLRSIEQNELAIVSDSQNKAILVFTGVTIVFLPLSFFTSYYGMNLRGIIDSGLTQGYFWRVCGSIAFAIVMIVALGAFRHRLKRALNPRRMRQFSMV